MKLFAIFCMLLIFVLFKTSAICLVDFFFEDVAREAGLDKENMGGFQHTFDYDNDGWQDIVLENFRGEIKFYRNKGDGSFEDKTQDVGLVQITKELKAQGYTIFPYDFDNDGDIDLVGGAEPGIAAPGGKIIFLENINGKFVNASQMGYLMLF